MIKNKVLDIKINFKSIKNILNFQIDFYFIKHHKIILKNCSQKLFFQSNFIKQLTNKVEILFLL